MIQHDKHQYYFEKYLRNEMSYHERMAFDEKLSEDTSLKDAFEYYKDHRYDMLHELIEEHRMLKRDNRLNKLIFLLISLTGIALTFNYYFYKAPAVRINHGSTEKPRKPLYTYIPFVNWEKRSEKAEARKEAAHKDSVATADAEAETDDDQIEVLEPSVRDDERTANDVFLTDTFIHILNKTYMENLLASRKQQADTAEQDSIVLVLPKSKTKGRTNELFVEFWQSPVKYRGYLFNGKKLILYGIEAPYEVYVYKEDDQVYVKHPYGETPLIENANFHAF